MSDWLDVAVVQLNTRHDKHENLETIERLVGEAATRGARVVALPEYATYLGPREAYGRIAEDLDGPTSGLYARLARDHGIYLHGGSFIERSDVPGKFFNTSLLLSPQGERLAVYRKIHLFDVSVDATASQRESEHLTPGGDVVTAKIDGHPTGFSICYDVRFPELYRALADRGAEVLFIPAAFTMFTGKDHWEVLLRARAIENLAFVVAPGQVGRHEPNGWCYGRSLIADPWGNVLAMAPDLEGVTLARLDFTALHRMRTSLPALQNRRL